MVSITEDMLYIQIAFESSRLDYDAKALRKFEYRIEPTQYPPGFRVHKKGIQPTQYAAVLSDLLYLVG